MDFSQSPTQSNDGRSYDRYFHGSPQSDRAAAHLEEPVQAVETLTESSIYEQKSLLEDDTGAVVFDLENPVSNHTDNSLPSDHSPQLAHASLRARNFALQQHTSQSQEQPPETPAVRHNPFAGNNHFQLLPTSQLFRATQFSSALRRGASPTSSRPSPNEFPHNTISPNPISSPLKARGLRSSPTTGHVSSPQVIRTTDSPRPGDEQTTPFNTRSTKGSVVSEVPRYHPPKTRAAPAPMDVYVPMHRSQERRSSSVVPLDTASPELSDDGDDPIDRRRRAKSKKEASLKQLTSIQFTRTPKSEDVEVPSTNTKKKKSRTPAQDYIDQCHGPGGSDEDSQLQDRVENSQDPPMMMERSLFYQSEELTQSSQGDVLVPAEDGIAGSSAVLGRPRSKRRRGNGLLRLDSMETAIANGETIPETSPVDTAPRHLLESPGATPTAVPKPSSNTVVVGSSRNLDDATGAPKSSVTEYVPPATASGKSTRGGYGPESPIAVSSSFEQPVSREEQKSSPTLPELNPEKLVAPSSSPPAPAFSTRSRTRHHNDLHVEGETPALPSSKEVPNPSTSMSTLSVLSGTPSLTMSTTTPGSQGSAASRKLRADYGEAANSSPAVAKNKRRRVGDLPRLKTVSATESLRASTRLSRQHLLDSTDELAKSPSMTPTFENSVRGPPRKSTSRPTRTSTADLQLLQDQSYRRPGRLFEGMAFAISFQAKRPGESEDEYGERMDAAGSLETKIAQAGGRILENGFDELFESGSVRSVITSPVSSTSSSPPQAADEDVNLVPAARHLGFTALVADGHSRKEKYMQALALGLPCVAARWITMCLDSGEIVDWAPYLLCAGQSAFLGGAYKSRILAPYDASHAQLARVIEARPRLLDGNRILLVMKKSEKKSEQGKKMLKYVFLARVLGATLCRVQSVNEAKAMVKASQEMGRPFDWVYAGGKIDKTELFAEAVTGATNTGGNSKKRKRGGGNTTATAGDPTKKIQTLTDELVIQSLILGRIIQEGEMEE
ncbi:hypothetical protein CONLIGDRAFT_632080 [Coniochaeta ligniaria NRRL 30616]|uniref:BRCT domain-containing protein n=1 Tax=Coniochaeta ligniaria NRRL 30616 TaxID=1408157 RepID=A0A1J7IR77_9PEZI|nr:hypothetical protein CONLIGDRAFT_632080 [Coniochaeta ligniaria NRRL 30616]